MTTPKQPIKKNAVKDTFSEDESLDIIPNKFVKDDTFDDDDFDMPLDDLDELEHFDADDEDDY